MNIITFDIEDWFHILEHDSTGTELKWIKFKTRIHESVNRILILLAEENVKATFFCLGWIAERYPEVIRLIDSLGHEIGSHSYSHQLVCHQTSDEVQQDIRRSVDILEDISGKKVKAYRAPGFSVTRKTPWIIDILDRCGIEIDCSISPARHTHGGEISFQGRRPQLISYKGIIIKELPLSYMNVYGLRMLFSGGGYFRLFPYWLISSLTRRSDYVMTYFHPRDFDPAQPVLQDLSHFRKFKSYYGLAGSYSKLSKLLQEFEFASVGEINQTVDWNSVDVFELG